MYKLCNGDSGIYQSNVETRAYPSAEIILWQGSRVIHEMFISRQSQPKNDWALINVVAENNCHLNTPNGMWQPEKVASTGVGRMLSIYSS